MMAMVSVISKTSKLEGKKVRYINYKEANYLIYTLDEKDNDGYEKLYINKIIDNEESIINDNEWDELKKSIPTIVKQIKAEVITIFNDLDIEEIKQVNIDYSRIFKLKIDIVESIIKKTEEEKMNLINEQLRELVKEENIVKDGDSLSKLEEFLKNPIVEEEIEIPKQPNEESINNDLREKLTQEQKNNEKLVNKIYDLEKEIKYYKDRLQQIKIMIDES